MTGLSSAILSIGLCLCAAGDDSKAQPEVREWTLEKHLAVGGQPTGREFLKLGDEVYRFIFTDAGMTSSHIVLAYRKGSGYHLRSAEVRLHDYYGSEGKQGVERKERKLTAVEWVGLQEKLKTLDFWNIAEPQPRLVLDGTIWTLEGAADGKSRKLTIHSPDAGPFRGAGLYLWRTSGDFMGNWADVKE